MSRKGKLLFLASGHGLNDFTAGYLLASLVSLPLSGAEQLGCFLVYNLLAFGGQYFVALHLKGVRFGRPYLLAAGAANIFAVLLLGHAPHGALLLAGCASAVYHVVGGSACAGNTKAAPIGLFAAPGIIGLAGAAYLAWTGFPAGNWLLGACILFTGGCSLSPFSLEPVAGVATREEPAVDRHDLLMILLLGLIALRSAAWNLFQLAYEGAYESLLFIALAAFAGKLAGGFLADRIGWRLYSFASLGIAAPLLAFMKEEFPLFCIGIGLLQSGIPASTALLIRAVDGDAKKGIALSLGTAVLAGALLTAPAALFSFSSVLLPLLLLLLLFSLLLARKRVGDFRF